MPNSIKRWLVPSEAIASAAPLALLLPHFNVGREAPCSQGGSGRSFCACASCDRGAAAIRRGQTPAAPSDRGPRQRSPARRRESGPELQHSPVFLLLGCFWFGQSSATASVIKCLFVIKLITSQELAVSLPELRGGKKGQV